MRQRIIGDDILNYEVELSNIINNQINPCVNNMDSLLNNISWQGQAKDSFTSNYKNTVLEIKKIANVLKVYIKFLSEVMGNYEELMQVLKNNYDELELELSSNAIGEIKGDKNE